MQNSIEFCRILHFPEYENGLEMVDPVMAVGIFRHKMFSGDPSIKIKWVAHCGFQKKELFLMNYRYYQYSKLLETAKFDGILHLKSIKKQGRSGPNSIKNGMEVPRDVKL